MPSEGKITVTYRCGHTGEVTYGSIHPAAEASSRADALRRPCWDCRIAGRRYRLAKVTIEGVIPPIDAYMIDNERWNGWVMPYFTKEQAEVYLAHILTLEGTGNAHYDPAQDAYVIPMMEDEPDIYAGEDITIDGETLHLYPIGSGCWVWEEDIPCTES